MLIAKHWHLTCQDNKLQSSGSRRDEHREHSVLARDRAPRTNICISWDKIPSFEPLNLQSNLTRGAGTKPPRQIPQIPLPPRRFQPQAHPPPHTLHSQTGVRPGASLLQTCIHSVEGTEKKHFFLIFPHFRQLFFAKDTFF